MQTITFRAQQPKKPHTISLHGFPAVRSQQNRFYADLVAKDLSRDCTVLLYDGLGFSPGVFSFKETLKEVDAYFSKFELAKDEKVDLLGHSWGGFLSLYLTSRYPERIGRLVLMSPLLEFGQAAQSRVELEKTAASNPQLKLADKLAEDFEWVGRTHPTAPMIQAIPESVKVTFLQAQSDQITPAQIAQAMLKNFKVAPVFELLDTDHSFIENRSQNAAKILLGLQR